MQLSSCNAGDPGSIPGLGIFPGEKIGYPLQYSWASLLLQSVKNLPAMQEIWIRSLGWEDPLEEGMATHSSILVWRIPMDRGAWWVLSMGSQRVGRDWATKHSTPPWVQTVSLLPKLQSFKAWWCDSSVLAFEAASPRMQLHSLLVTFPELH